MYARREEIETVQSYGEELKLGTLFGHRFIRCTITWDSFNLYFARRKEIRMDPLGHNTSIMLLENHMPNPRFIHSTLFTAKFL